jgi:hypothetical protein
MESRKRRKRSRREERGHRTRKRDGCQNGEHVEKEWKRGRISSNTIRSRREDGKRGRGRETKKKTKEKRRRKKKRNKKRCTNKD